MKDRYRATYVGRVDFLIGEPAGLPYAPLKITGRFYYPRVVAPEERKPKPKP